MNLDCAIDHVASHARGNHLDHRDVLERTFCANCVDQVSAVKHEQPGLIKLDSAQSNLLLDHAVLVQFPTESLTGQRALNHELQCSLSHADGTHTVVHAPRAKPTLGNRKSSTFFQEYVCDGNTHVRETYLEVAVRRIIVPEDVSTGTRIMLCCLWRLAWFGLVFAMTIKILQFGWPKPLLHHLRPLIT